jgi:hypothetical protein
VFQFKISVSISFIIIFSLITLISSISESLFIVNKTVVQAGHFIHEITSLREFSFFISFQSTFKIISHHFNHAFSEGDHGIGDIILTIPGFSIST